MAEKGDSTDNVASDLTIKLPLGSEKDKGFATTQQKLIREVGRILQSLGEIVEVEEEEKKESQQQQPVSVKDYILSSTKTLFETLGIILDWLEQSTENAKEEMKKETSDKKQLEDKTDGENKDNVDGKEKAVSELQKKEGVLRGLFHITGKFITSVTFYYLSTINQIYLLLMARFFLALLGSHTLIN